MIPRKVYFFAFLLSLAFLLVILKLASLQILAKDKLIKYIENQYYTKENVVLPRGTIYDRKGKIFAISVPTITVYVLPQYIKDLKNKNKKVIKTALQRKKELAEKLSPVLKKSQTWILNKLKENQYVVLARNLDKTLKPVIEDIRRETKIWNLGIVESSKRYYPMNKLSANNIGFVSRTTGLGAEGLELKLNSVLGGGLGKVLFLKDALDNPITVVKEEKKESKDVVLTIDANIQEMAEEALKKLVKLRKPKEAVVLILNPNTGEILANAVYPTYNPNYYWKYRWFGNPTFRGMYEVGSLAKPFVMARAIATGKVKENELIWGGNGVMYVDGVRIRDHRPFKWITPKDIIVHSSNVGIIKVALRFKPTEFYSIFTRLGFGKSTHTFPGESRGRLRPDPRPVQIAYAAIGQSWTATPIQVAVAYSAIANGGYLVKPHFVKEVISKDGKKEVYQFQKGEKVLSDKEVKWLKEVLKLVVEKGTAHKGKSKYYTIAGKTGTAQKYDPKIHALSNKKFYTWFAGFFPVEKPKYTIVVFANEPKKIKKWEVIGGGSVSSTVLKELVDRLMFYSKEKPDKKVDKGEKNIHTNSR